MSGSTDRPPPPEIMEMIRAGCGGDRRALEMLIRTYQARIARFVMSNTADVPHCEDLCQTVFVKMVLALPRLRTAERFEPWLFQIARNVCRDHLRSRLGWRRLFVAGEVRHESIAAPEAEHDESDRALETGMARLPASQRELLEQQLGGGTSYEELARRSNTSVSAVKSRLHRARASLREFLMAGESK